ncbi:MAG: hypothetical protein KAS32_31275 [Candidatus Peribacteraceae bacterium]|nr:hypothetical protein [Candidatus Peribacteraceae bacterium]
MVVKVMKEMWEVIDSIHMRTKLFTIAAVFTMVILCLCLVECSPSDSQIYTAYIKEKTFLEDGKFRYKISSNDSNISYNYTISAEPNLQLDSDIYLILSPSEYSVARINENDIITISKCEPTKLVKGYENYILHCDLSGFNPPKTEIGLNEIPKWAKSYNLLFVTENGLDDWEKQF